MPTRLGLLRAEPDSVGGFNRGDEIAVAPGSEFGHSGESPGVFHARTTGLDAIVKVVVE